MKRTILSKLIVLVVICMTILNSILPTSYASVFLKEYYNKKEIESTGVYSIYAVNSATDVFEDYPSEIDKFVVYYEDDSGQIKTLEPNEDGFYELDAGTVCYYAKGMSFSAIETDDASLIERLITKLLMLVGSALYGLVCLVIGEKFSIERVIFNDYGNTKLSFFTNGISESSLNPFIEDSGIKNILNDFFNFFTGIALAVYLIILVYMAIKIMLGSTAERGSKYKQLLMYWLEGVLILFLFPYVMKYSIQINDSFVSFIGANKGNFLQEPTVDVASGDKTLSDIPDMVDEIKATIKNNDDYMSIMYNNALRRGWLVFAICWYVMFFQMIGFLFVYFKRVLIILFLIAVFPLVMISYAIDKIGDSKSQAFNNWVKEFMVNVFIQSFHVIAYVLIMSLISVLMSNPSENWLIILIAISFVSKGDDILRAIFSLNSGADTIKGIGATVAQVAAVSSITKGVSGIANRLVGPGSKPRAVVNRVSAISQKAWDKADNRVTRTAKKLELDDLMQTINENELISQEMKGNFDVNLLSAEEIEKNLSTDIKNLTGKNKNVTEEDMQLSANRFAAYMNQTDNANVQRAIEKLRKGGYSTREINITQNVNIIVSCLKKNPDGTLTKESKELLNKITEAEGNLQTMMLFGTVKFNKESRKEVISSKTKKDGKNYTARRDTKNARSRAKGRGASKGRKELVNAKSSLDYKMKVSGEVPVSKKERKKINRVSNRAILPGTERASAKINKDTSGNRVNTNPSQSGKKSVFKAVKKENKPWDNIESMKNTPQSQSSGVSGKGASSLDSAIRYSNSNSSSAEKSSSATTNYGNKIPTAKGINASANTAPRTVREMAEAKKKVSEEAKKGNQNKGKEESSGTKFKITRDEPKSNNSKNSQNKTTMGSSTSGNTNANSNTKQNVGADIANKQGSAENLEDIINREAYVSRADKILNEMRKNRGFDSALGRMEEKEELRVSYSKLDNGLQEYIDEKIKNKPYSKAAKKDFESAVRSIAMLSAAGEGDFTAKELLDNVKSLREKQKKYETHRVDERMAMEDITKQLGFKLDDYEAYLRIKILNDPDSVGNDRAIIEECKTYVKNTTMPSSIRNRLGYNLDDLKEGVNPKYVKSKDTSNDGLVTDEQKTRMQETYKAKLKANVLQKQINELDKKNDKDYSGKEFAKEAGKLVLDGGKAVIDLYATGVSAGLGVVTTGLTTDGKKDIAAQAATGFFTGYNAASDLYNNTVNTGVGLYEDVKDVVVNDIKPQKEAKKKDEKNDKKE